MFSTIWRSIWGREEISLCPKSKPKVSFTKSCRLSSTSTNIAYSTEISNHKICWLTNTELPLSWLILGSLAPLVSQLRPIRTKSSHFGTDVLKSCLGKRRTVLASICGQQGASSLRWSKGNPSLWVTLKSTKFSRFSEFWEPQTKTTGQMPSNLTTSNRPSPSFQACLWLNIRAPLMKWRSTKWQAK